MPPKDWKGIQLNLVNQRQAMILKNMGFDSFCQTTWTRNHNGDWEFDENGGMKDDKDGEVIYTPTVDLALKWIRKKFGIHVSSVRVDGCNYVEMVDDETNTKVSMASGIKFLDKEDSDMHGLDIALEFIPNRKNKNVLSSGIEQLSLNR